MKKIFDFEIINISNVVLAMLLLASGVYSLMNFIVQVIYIDNIQSDLFSTNFLVPDYYKALTMILFSGGCFVLAFFVLKNCISFIQLVGISAIAISFIFKLITYIFFYDYTDFANQPFFIVSDALGVIITGFAFYVVIKSADIIFNLVDLAILLNILYFILVIFCCIFYYGFHIEKYWSLIFYAAAVSFGYISICNTCIRVSNKFNAVRLNVKMFSSQENRPVVQKRLLTFKKYQEWYKTGILTAKEFFSKGSDVIGKENLIQLKITTEKFKAGELSEEQYEEIKKEILGLK